MTNLRVQLATLETELRDLIFMHKEGYIVRGVRGNDATPGQLTATINHAWEAFENVKAEISKNPNY